MDLAPHKKQIARSLNTLEDTLERLVAALAHRQVWVTVDGARTEADAVRRACAAYSAIDYDTKDEINTSTVCLGVLGVPSDVLRRAAAVNQAKDNLKTACIPLQRQFVRVLSKDEPPISEIVPAIRVVLRSIQRSDLNLLAAYRRIPILDVPPASVTYTRANTRAVYRKTVSAIDAMLAKLDTPSALSDRDKLATLPSKEKHLALVKGRYQNIRANILYEHLDKRGRGRVQKAAELPLIYAKGRSTTQPLVTFPPPDEIGLVRARESKLAPEPFLQSLPVYRYLRS